MKVQFKIGLLTFSSSSAIIMEDLIKSLSVLKLHIIHLQYINCHVESLLPSSKAFTINSSCFFFSRSSHMRSVIRNENIFAKVSLLPNNWELKIYDATVAKTSLKISSSRMSIFFVNISFCVTFKT